LRKEIQKKEKGDRRCWADPPPFRPSQTSQPASPSLSLPRAAPASLHPAPAMWRPYAGVVDAPRPTRLHLVGTPPRALRRLHSVPSPLPSSSSARERHHRSRSAAAPSPEKPRCSPPVTPVAYPRRQSHHCTRLRCGKLLRTLYRGKRPPYTVNRSSELLRPHWRAPPR